MAGSRIIDNNTGNLAECPKEALTGAYEAAFSIHGHDLPADNPDGVDRVRFLFGEPPTRWMFKTRAGPFNAGRRGHTADPNSR